MQIGILAIQGDVIEHRKVLESLGVGVKEVRLPDDLQGISGIILPGGESTTQSLLLKRFGLFDILKSLIEEGLPVWGTCAGAILLAKKVSGKHPPLTLEVMDIAADRNAYGAQLESFTSEVRVSLPVDEKYIQAVFIRAPKLESLNESVHTLAWHRDSTVMFEQKNMLATSFHPELAGNSIIHDYFLSTCAEFRRSGL